MERKWTNAQSTAIDMKDRTLLVSAAAGSGKTATLTERVIRSLTDPEHPVDIDRILIVTFTKAAAAELRQRISDALTKKLAEEPGNTRLYRQILNLSSAHISTIDSFCLDAVRTHFSEFGLPASFRIGDAAELDPMCERIMEQLIDTFYTRYAQPSDAREDSLFSLLENNLFADLCDCLTPPKNDEKLVPTLFEFYKRLFDFPEGLERLKTEGDRLTEQASGEFLNSDHGSLLREWLSELCRSAIPFYADACDLLATDDKTAKNYLPAFECDRDLLLNVQNALTSGGFEEIRTLFSAYQKQSLKPVTGAEPAVVTAKLRRDIYADELTTLRDNFFTNAFPVKEQMEQCGRMCHVLYDFLAHFDKEIMAEKCARGVFDFFDISRLLLEKLQTPKGCPTPMADEYAGRFDQVYVDEYQDVNQVQDRIFSLIGRNHRFMVGDIKQSIYGFRGADPSVFADYRRTLPLIPTEGETATPPLSTPVTGGSIFMSDNFRCDETVIKVTNAICGHCFGACPNSIAYKAEDDLGFAKKPPTEDYQAPCVQIDILMPESKKDKEARETDPNAPTYSKSEAEAIHVANRIAELLRTGALLADGQPIRPCDIAILVRSNNRLAEFSSALSAMGIPTGCEELDRAEAGQTILRGRQMM